MLLSAAVTGGILCIIGAGAGYWLASGLGQVLVPEPEKVSDYVGITLTCGIIPLVLGGILGASVYSLVNRPKASE
jgi:hypothetical protein